MSNNSQNFPTPLRVLIIDDNPFLLRVFEKMLRIKGFFVSTETTKKGFTTS